MKNAVIEPVEWKVSFSLPDGRVFVSDKKILIDQQYVFTDPLPPDGKARQYARVRTNLKLVAQNNFGLNEMTPTAGGNYRGPDHMALSRKYIAFLLQRIPAENLRFGMTGGYDKAVWIYRDEVPVGFAMPFLEIPYFDQKLIDEAEAGSVYAQFYLGHAYHTGSGQAPEDFGEARRWYEKAMQQGHARAQFCLGFPAAGALLCVLFFIQTA